MLVKGTKSASGVNEPCAGNLWVHKSEGLKFDTGNITRLMFHYSLMRV